MIHYSDQKPKAGKFFDEVVKKQWDLRRVLADLDPEDHDHYVKIKCPQCGKKEAFAYKETGVLRCSRKSKCQFESSVIEHVAGVPSPRGIDFKQAVIDICKRCGIKSPESLETSNDEELAKQQEEQRKRQEIAEILSLFREYTVGAFREKGDTARAYLHGRGITDQGIAEIGHGVFESDGDFKTKLKERGLSVDTAYELGLCQQRLTGYVTIPIGGARPVGFVFRYPDSEDNLPLMRDKAGWEKQREEILAENPATEPKIKKTELSWGSGVKSFPYAFDRVLKNKHKTVVAVEGPFDADLPHVHGDTRVVATCGAGVTREQARTLKQYGIESVIVVGDPDAAGEKGQDQSIVTLTREGINCYIASTLPDGLDPAAYVLDRGVDAWRAHVDAHDHFLRYQAKKLIRQYATKDGFAPANQESAIREASDFVVRLGLPLERMPEIEFELIEPLSKAGANKKLLAGRIKASLEGRAEIESQRKLNRAISSTPENFRVEDDGTYFRTISKDEGVRWHRIADPLHIIGYARNYSGEEWGYYTEFKDRDGEKRAHVVPFTAFAGDGKELREQLAKRGFKIEPTSFARTAFNQYLYESAPNQRCRVVDGIGWYENNTVFVLPDETITKDDSKEKVFLNPSLSGDYSTLKVRGDLEQWQRTVGMACRENSRFGLGFGISFSSCLHRLMEVESSVVNFRDRSSSGKSTLLHVLASVWGGNPERKIGYLETWNATSNALENVCQSHRDILLALDEMGQSPPHSIGETAYLIGNESPKSRQQKDGSLRKKSYWRLACVSSGEVSMEQLTAEAGKKSKAGQSIRILDIPADAGKGLGIFDNTRKSEPSKFAEMLESAAKDNYGTAGRAFLKALMKDHSWRSFITDMTEKFIRTQVTDFNKGKKADGQIFRVARRFGLYAAGGELAIKYNILPWNKGEVYDSVVRCFQEWVAARGGWRNKESVDVVTEMKKHLAEHGSSNYPLICTENGTVNLADPKANPPKRFGYRKMVDGKLYYLIFPTTFRGDIYKDDRFAVKVLGELGFLVSENGRYQPYHTLPEMGRVRMYQVSADIMDHDFDPEAQAEKAALDPRQHKIFEEKKVATQESGANVVQFERKEKHYSVEETRDYLLNASGEDEYDMEAFTLRRKAGSA